MNQYTIEYEFMKEENLFLKRKVYIGLSHKRGSHAFYPCHANILSARGQAARQNKKIKKNISALLEVPMLKFIHAVCLLDNQ